MNTIFNFSGTIIMRTRVYHRTASGKSWKSKPAAEKYDNITVQEYNNRVSSVSFMNGFCGGTARAYSTYTSAGYIPYRITLINPSRTEKIIEEYRFSSVR